MTPAVILRFVTVVSTDISEELIAFIFLVTRIGNLEILAVSTNQKTLKSY
jgi:hypothetical protein